MKRGSSLRHQNCAFDSGINVQHYSIIFSENLNKNQPRSTTKVLVLYFRCVVCFIHFLYWVNPLCYFLTLSFFFTGDGPLFQFVLFMANSWQVLDLWEVFLIRTGSEKDPHLANIMGFREMKGVLKRFRMDMINSPPPQQWSTGFNVKVPVLVRQVSFPG